MQIPLSDPTAGYPQPYATWAKERADAGDQSDAASNEQPAQDATTSSYTVDVSA